MVLKLSRSVCRRFDHVWTFQLATMLNMNTFISLCLLPSWYEAQMSQIYSIQSCINTLIVHIVYTEIFADFVNACLWRNFFPIIFCTVKILIHSRGGVHKCTCIYIGGSRAVLRVLVNSPLAYWCIHIHTFKHIAYESVSVSQHTAYRLSISLSAHSV